MNRVYGGIDIGKHSSFACRIDVENQTVQFPDRSLGNEPMRDWFRDNPVQSICIDGPPQPNNGNLAKRLPPKTRFNTQRRVAEFALQIYGCYGTPDQQPEADSNSGWMASSMNLFRLLEESFAWKVDLGDGEGELMETHPTYAFKSLLGRVTGHLEGDIQQIIVDPDRKLAPKRPRRAGGHNQRIELLEQAFKQLGLEIKTAVRDRWTKSIDCVDATLCALIALWKSEKHNSLLGVGDPTEGAIYIPCPTSPFNMEAPDLASWSSPQRKTKAEEIEPANAIFMRLGSDGPGGLSQAETIALAQLAFDEGE